METTYVRIGEIKYSHITGNNLQAVALGSCVAVVIYDPVIKVAGMAHVALPDYRGEPKRVKVDNFKEVGRYADTAIPELLQQLRGKGGLRSRMKAKIAGGANIFGTKGIYLDSSLNIGQRNGRRVRELLDENNIPVLGQDLGGDTARTVTFDIKTQKMIITNSAQVTRKVI